MVTVKLRHGFSATELTSLGYAAADLTAGGYTAQECVAAGWPTKELRCREGLQVIPLLSCGARA